MDGALKVIRGGGPMRGFDKAVIEVLKAIDHHLHELDASVTRLHEMGATDLAAPRVAVAIAEHAAAADLHLRVIGERIAEVREWLRESRDRLEAVTDQGDRYLTIGALVGTAVGVVGAWRSAQLFRRGRRWSRRQPGCSPEGFPVGSGLPWRREAVNECDHRLPRELDRGVRPRGAHRAAVKAMADD